MTDNLALDLGTYSAPVTVKRARYDSIQTEDWTPTGTGGNNTEEPMNNNTKTPAPNGAYYYNWYAATAGSGTAAQTGTEAEWSICPAGWKLPANYTISTTKSYGSLTNVYNLTVNGANNSNNNTSTFEAIPLSFNRLGTYYSGSPYGPSLWGFYTSSTASGSDNRFMFGLIYGTGNNGTHYTYPQGSTVYKNEAASIRCVAL